MTWFGGKRRVAAEVWARFGDVPNYVEPFFGSGAVLLGRPNPPRIETVNDKDGFIVNFWRALRADPDSVTEWADRPLYESDLHAIHAWLMQNSDDLVPRLEGDPDYYDVKIAGWWVWGISSWIGAGFCSGKGPWRSVEDEDGTKRLLKIGADGLIKRPLPHVSDAGTGINRKLLHGSDAGTGVHRKLISFGRRRVGYHADSRHETLLEYMRDLSDRLRLVRVCCGDWTRVLTNGPTTRIGTTAVFLDPPYSDKAARSGKLYSVDSLDVAHDVREWCEKNGGDHRLRIALCGYEGEHENLADAGWACYRWSADGGYSKGEKGKIKNENRHREVIWFSPYCLNPPVLELHDDEMGHGLHWTVQTTSS